MKKSLIIALLIALVIGMFTACDGDVFADLIDEKEETKRTITLIIKDFYGHGWTFKDGTETITKEIPADCTTWGDLVEEGFTVDMKKSATTPTWTLLNHGDLVWFSYEPGDLVVSVELDNKAINSTSVNEEIIIGETYIIAIFDYSGMY